MGVMKPAFSGMLPAVLTPLDAQGEFAVAPFEKLLERIYAGGSHGVYVCGNTGEGLVLNVQTRKLAAEAAVKNSPAGKSVIVHVGAHNTADAIELAKHAAKAGAHAVSSLAPSPFYNFEETKQYYAALAAAAGLPVLVYYIPSYPSAVHTLDQILELCALPGVVGLKFTADDMYSLSLISRAGHVIFSGRDEVFAAGSLMGACGGIGTFYNMLPEQFVAMYNLGREGRYKEARAIQDKVNNLIRAVLRFPALSAVKLLMTWSGIDCGKTVEPRRWLTVAEEKKLRIDVREAGFDPEGFGHAQGM
jgi:N-acetylneuraminate lyase